MVYKMYAFNAIIESIRRFDVLRHHPWISRIPGFTHQVEAEGVRQHGHLHSGAFAPDMTIRSKPPARQENVDFLSLEFCKENPKDSLVLQANFDLYMGRRFSRPPDLITCNGDMDKQGPLFLTVAMKVDTSTSPKRPQVPALHVESSPSLEIRHWMRCSRFRTPTVQNHGWPFLVDPQVAHLRQS